MECRLHQPREPPQEPTLPEGIDYLLGSLREWRQTGAIAPIHIPNGWGKPFREHPIVTRLLKGIGNLKPEMIRYDITWDQRTLLWS